MDPDQAPAPSPVVASLRFWVRNTFVIAVWALWSIVLALRFLGRLIANGWRSRPLRTLLGLGTLALGISAAIQILPLVYHRFACVYEIRHQLSHASGKSYADEKGLLQQALRRHGFRADASSPQMNGQMIELESVRDPDHTDGLERLGARIHAHRPFRLWGLIPLAMPLRTRVVEVVVPVDFEDRRRKREAGEFLE
ncbi:MAG TPA: hypothetical protein PKL14_09180 [Holophaga sp.]|nr:hypothetical protein [Holophaga sp.]